MSSHDAIVIGAGPAGAAAALELASQGARVLVVAKREGRRKPCGGCISKRFLPLLEEYAPGGRFGEHQVRSVALASPGEPTLRASHPRGVALLVERSGLDRCFRRQIQARDIPLIQDKVLGIRRQGAGYQVRTSQGAFAADWLIGADGAFSLVGRHTGLGRTGHGYLALAEERPAAEHAGRFPPESALLEIGGFPGGYGWIFRRDHTLNLGIVQWAGAKRGGGSLLKHYAAFLARHGLGAPGAWRGWTIPCPAWRPPLVARERACLVGDAAAAADPLLGEGIGQALHSGRLAARAVLAGDLAQYRSALRGLWQEHRHGWLVARLVYGWPRFFHDLARRRPGALKLGFAVLRGELSLPGLWGALAARLLSRQPSLDPEAGGYYSKHLN